MTLYYKIRQTLLQNATEAYYKMRQVFYYKMRQLLEKKCDVYYKLRQYIRSCSELRVKPLLFYASQNSSSRLERNTMRGEVFVMGVCVCVLTG